MGTLIKNTEAYLRQITLPLLWEKAVNDQNAVAIWKLPQKQIFHFLADISGKPSQVKVNFEDSVAGFCFSPFLNDGGHQTFLLKNDYHFTFNESNELIENEVFTIKEHLFFEKILKLDSSSKPEIKSNSELSFTGTSLKTKSSFEEMVSLATEEIKNGFLQKVVASRKKEMKLARPLQVVETINKLARKYPNAFISAVYLPEFDSVWLGASPELLVSIDENGIFKTMSLAGTQSAYEHDGSKILPGHARWSQKEIEEQALVSRYIIECFKKVRVREYLENGPKTVEAGNLLHLQTDFVVDTNAIEFKQFSTVLLELLHPTSAVCGMPKAAALDFILKNENYNREFYCGFLGPININKASHVFVNLRTMKVLGDTVSFYAGAGLTEDSVPEKEWYETEMKMDTLYSVLF